MSRWALSAAAMLAAAGCQPAGRARHAAAAPATARKPRSPTALALLVERRAARLAELPPAPEPPAVDGADQQSASIGSSSPRWSALAGRRAADGQLCDDATFARRVYLDLIGVIPTRGRAESFSGRLVARQADASWSIICWIARPNTRPIGPSFGKTRWPARTVLAQGGIPTRGNYRQWLLDSFTANKPYDVMLAELIDPTMPGHQAAENQDLFGTKYQVEFVRNEDHTVTLQTAAAVGQVFLSTAMKCASCHDHFENAQWTQERFLGFAGLFAPRDLEQIRCDVHSRPIRRRPAFPSICRARRSRFPASSTTGLHLAAQLIVDPANELFAKSIVNRLWKRYLGLGLFEPVDDYRPERRRVASRAARLAGPRFCRPRLRSEAHDPADSDQPHVSIALRAEVCRSLRRGRSVGAALFPFARLAPPDGRAGDRQPAPGRRAANCSRASGRISTPASRRLAAALGRPASRNEISTAAIRRRGGRAGAGIAQRPRDSGADRHQRAGGPAGRQARSQAAGRSALSGDAQPAGHAGRKAAGPGAAGRFAHRVRRFERHLLGAGRQPGISIHQIDRCIEKRNVPLRSRRIDWELL